MPLLESIRELAPFQLLPGADPQTGAEQVSLPELIATMLGAAWSAQGQPIGPAVSALAGAFGDTREGRAATAKKRRLAEIYGKLPGMEGQGEAIAELPNPAEAMRIFQERAKESARNKAIDIAEAQTAGGGLGSPVGGFGSPAGGVTVPYALPSAVAPATGIPSSGERIADLEFFRATGRFLPKQKDEKRPSGPKLTGTLSNEIWRMTGGDPEKIRELEADPVKREAAFRAAGATATQLAGARAAATGQATLGREEALEVFKEVRKLQQPIGAKEASGYADPDTGESPPANTPRGDVEQGQWVPVDSKSKESLRRLNVAIQGFENLPDTLQKLLPSASGNWFQDMANVQLTKGALAARRAAGDPAVADFDAFNANVVPLLPALAGTVRPPPIDTEMLKGFKLEGGTVQSVMAKTDRILEILRRAKSQIVGKARGQVGEPPSGYGRTRAKEGVAARDGAIQKLMQDHGWDRARAAKAYDDWKARSGAVGR